MAGSSQLTISNEFIAWDNGAGVSGSESSSFLFALDGQSDSEGPVNYDIFAAFNRAVASASRIGSGVGEVTVCLRDLEEAGCFESNSVNIVSDSEWRSSDLLIDGWETLGFDDSSACATAGSEAMEEVMKLELPFDPGINDRGYQLPDYLQ